MSIFTLWVVSVIATGVIAHQKRLETFAYIVFAIFTGPVALFFVLFARDKSKDERLNATRPVETLPEAARQLRETRKRIDDLQQEIKRLLLKVDQIERCVYGMRSQADPGLAAPTQELSLDRVETSDILPQAGAMDEHSSEQTDIEELSPVDTSEPALEDQVEEIPAEEALTRHAGQSRALDKTPTKGRKTSNMELDIGRYWLNKIGIIVFTLGMGFLISYTFKYFSPYLKVLLGYVICVALFYLGKTFERQERYLNFSRVMFGGAWALTYFTTYAMHHFEASRIIHSQIFDLFLLALVVAGMIGHALKYKSETMVSLSLFIAYVTATLGHITTFTFISCALLSIVILVLVHKLQWVNILILGIMLTFGVHYIWVRPNIALSSVAPSFLGIPTGQSSLLMNFFFLTVYWLVYLLGIHVLKPQDDDKRRNTLAGVNFGNFILYSFMAYPLITKLFYDQCFLAVLSIGLFYLLAALWTKKEKNQTLFRGDMIIAVMAITFAIPLKFVPQTTLLLWFIEIPFLIFVGYHFKQRIFQYLSFAVTVLVTYQFMAITIFEADRGPVPFMGWVLTFNEFMFLWGSISMAACCALMRKARKSVDANALERLFDHIFSAKACLYLSFFVWSVASSEWQTFILTVLAALLFTLADYVKLRRFRMYCYLLFWFVVFRFLSMPVPYHLSVPDWLRIGGQAGVIFGTYYRLKALHRAQGDDGQESTAPVEEWTLFCAGGVFLMHMLLNYIDGAWGSLALGCVGVIFYAIGRVRQDKPSVYFNYLATVLVVIRFIPVWGQARFSPVHFVGVWLSWYEFNYLCAGLFMTVCFMLSQRGRKPTGSLTLDLIFDHVFSCLASVYGVLFISSLALKHWVTFTLSIEAMILFSLAFVLRLRRFKVYSYVLLGIVFARFVFWDDYALTLVARWLIILVELFPFFGIYFFAKSVGEDQDLLPFRDKEKEGLFVVGMLMLICAVFRYVAGEWVSLGFGVSGVFWFIMGFVLKDKTSRVGGMVLFALTLLRIVFVDISELDIIYKIISFIILGVLFLGISFMYNKYLVGKPEEE
ncbi:MAG: DUF2339 domain-containing protein [Candidatus Omnitrophica bacterium]|nr:DUF2339 domain-containing protein [Candidatus Omnitrophota bacterium]